MTVPFPRDHGPPVAFPPGFKLGNFKGDLELKYQRRDVYAYGKERTFKEKIKDIQKRISWAQKIGPYRDGRRRKFKLLSDRLIKTSEGSKVDNEDKKLLNIYDILLPHPGIDLTKGVIKHQIQWLKEHLEKEPQLFQLESSHYQAILDRLENFQPEPNDMIDIGLADPEHDGTCYLPEFGWYTDISQEAEEARAKAREARRVKAAEQAEAEREARKAKLVSAETRQLLAKLTRGKSNSEASGSRTSH
ncbi:hypothetical protein F5878DRAFT_412795 [Lentinula raphanica]|uniref:Uncharacterized protein n=1 Tax=Lentinula raphanica TaxID=153919 RepID=A0AA38U6P2_9AGAR|nr:hypothetical protein F5878DRAFT_412795 [Lentinula raphanica]